VAEPDRAAKVDVEFGGVGRLALVALAFVGLASCSSPSRDRFATATKTAPTETTATETTSTALSSADPLAGRPFDVVVPSSYRASTPAGLIVVLHGYTASGAAIRTYFNLQDESEKRGLLAVYPDGTKDRNGARFWNATDACCNFADSPVDDSAYLLAIIDNVQEHYNIDPKRIWLAGHSNGGFMSYRMACEHADRIAAIVSLAGATFADAAVCKPTQPVSILQIHGDADHVIDYTGGQIAGHPFPAAIGTVTTWAAYDGCRATPEVNTPDLDIDLESALPGPETRITSFAGCRTGGGVELWTIEGGAHSPALSPDFPKRIVDFLYAHPKP
jgi:polyhydroxybutyrate depolymerase